MHTFTKVASKAPKGTFKCPKLGNKWLHSLMSTVAHNSGVVECLFEYRRTAGK